MKVSIADIADIVEPLAGLTGLAFVIYILISAFSSEVLDIDTVYFDSKGELRAAYYEFKGDDDVTRERTAISEEEIKPDDIENSYTWESLNHWSEGIRSDAIRKLSSFTNSLLVENELRSILGSKFEKASVRHDALCALIKMDEASTETIDKYFKLYAFGAKHPSFLPSGCLDEKHLEMNSIRTRIFDEYKYSAHSSINLVVNYALKDDAMREELSKHLSRRGISRFFTRYLGSTELYFSDDDLESVVDILTHPKILHNDKRAEMALLEFMDDTKDLELYEYAADRFIQAYSKHVGFENIISEKLESEDTKFVDTSIEILSIVERGRFQRTNFDIHQDTIEILLKILVKADADNREKIVHILAPFLATRENLENEDGESDTATTWILINTEIRRLCKDLDESVRSAADEGLRRVGESC